MAVGKASHLPRQPGSKGVPTSPELEPKSLEHRLGWALLFIHLALSPLLFTTATLEHFEYPKTCLLVLVAILLGALALCSGIRHVAEARVSAWCEMLRNQVRLLGRDPLALGFVSFLISATCSTAVSLCPRMSFWGAHESHGGLCTVIAYTVLFFATRAFCQARDDMRRLLLASVLAAGILSAYSVLQFARRDPIAWTGVSAVGGLIADTYVRPFGTMGHANFMAAFLVMVFPLTGYFARRVATNRQWAGVLTFTLIGVISLAAIGFALSRGAWLALAGTGAVLLAGCFRRDRRRFLARGGRITVLAALALVPLLLTWGDRTLLANAGARLSHLTDAGSRLHIWRSALAIFQDHPLLGCGLDTFQLAFGPKRTPMYWELERDVTPTRAHNEVIHILATQGILGAAALVLLLTGLARAGRRAWQGAAAAERPLVLAVLAGSAGFLLQDAFSYTVAGCGTLFVTFAALLSCLGQRGGSAESPVSSDRRGAYLAAVVVASGAAALIFFFNFTRQTPLHGNAPAFGTLLMMVVIGVTALALLRAEGPGLLASFWPRARTGTQYGRLRSTQRLTLGRPILQLAVAACAAAVAAVVVVRPFQTNVMCCTGESLLEQDPQQAVTAIARATGREPANDLYWSKLGAAAKQAARLSQGTERGSWLAFARNALERACSLVPLNAYHHANVGQLLSQLATEGLACPSEAFAELDVALELDPNNGTLYADAAQAACAVGDLARAKGFAEQGAALFPHFSRALAHLGYLALVEGRYDDAISLLETAFRGSWPDHPDEATACLANMAATQMQRRQLVSAMECYRLLLERAPQLAAAHYPYARVLETLGFRKQAVDEYRRALEHFPSRGSAREALSRLGVSPPSAIP